MEDVQMTINTKRVGVGTWRLLEIEMGEEGMRCIDCSN